MLTSGAGPSPRVPVTPGPGSPPSIFNTPGERGCYLSTFVLTTLAGLFSRLNSTDNAALDISFLGGGFC